MNIYEDIISITALLLFIGSGAQISGDLQCSLNPLYCNLKGDKDHLNVMGGEKYYCCENESGNFSELKNFTETLSGKCNTICQKEKNATEINIYKYFVYEEDSFYCFGDAHIEASNTTVDEGDNINLTCSTHKKVPGMSWFKDNGTLVNRTQSNNLNLTNVSATDPGSYYCTAINCSSASNRIEIIINCSTFNVTISATSLAVNDMDNITLICITDHEVQEVLWFKDALLFNRTQSTNLTITNVLKNSTGSYYCTARRSCGNSTSNTIFITVTAKRKPRTRSNTNSTATVTSEC
ncbi:limbic system-associated membrane protein-like isoform X2 [Polyodon spathula]|uniref:limbic system-associated membrane protein-like isoform X2 n=1 Tax=Polyodon spathula TaxID=7913 RepID=UPI001B7EA97D|nr:limbic system-associated membrane protein-like isoform X2 [Polyodon spathula]